LLCSYNPTIEGTTKRSKEYLGVGHADLKVPEVKIRGQPLQCRKDKAQQVHVGGGWGTRPKTFSQGVLKGGKDIGVEICWK